MATSTFFAVQQVAAVPSVNVSVPRWIVLTLLCSTTFDSPNVVDDLVLVVVTAAAAATVVAAAVVVIVAVGRAFAAGDAVE